MDCHFIRTKFAEGLVDLFPVSRTHQFAVIFTKPLTGIIHHSVCSSWECIPPPTCEGRGEMEYINSFSETHLVLYILIEPTLFIL